MSRRRNRAVYDALTAAGVDKKVIYEDRASGKKDSRLGRDLHHLVSVMQELTKRGIGLQVLASRGPQVRSGESERSECGSDAE